MDDPHHLSYESAQLCNCDSFAGVPMKGEGLSSMVCEFVVSYWRF